MSQFFFMLLLVTVGGALGGAIRMSVGERLAAGLRQRPRTVHFPWPTMGINLAGCFLLGCLLSGVDQQTMQNDALWALAGIGLIGALTTVSSFSLEVVALVRDRRFEVAGGYILACMFGCPLALLIGRLSSQAFLGASA